MTKSAFKISIILSSDSWPKSVDIVLTTLTICFCNSTSKQTKICKITDQLVKNASVLSPFYLSSLLANGDGTHASQDFVFLLEM